jgi:hypothetical protein
MNNATNAALAAEGKPAPAPKLVTGKPAQVVKMPKQKGGKVNYTPEQLAAYLESQLTGKANNGKPFDQPVGETNFTDEDRKLIQEARRMHRETLSAGEAKSAIFHEIAKPHWKLIGSRENAKGNRKGLRLFNPTIQA